MKSYKFNTRVQRNEETANQYVTELKLLAKNCNFGALKDELIRDCVVYGINSERVKERLLREENLTLEKALLLCRVNEQSSKQLRGMKEEKDAISRKQSTKASHDQ